MERTRLVYVTGMPGSGKSTVCEELKRRGCAAFDTDEDSIADFYDNVTGEAVGDHVPAEVRTAEWRARHSWLAKREVVEELIASSPEPLVFLCGVTANDDDGYGKHPDEHASLMEWHKTAESDYAKLGVTLIDASQPVDDVVDAILAAPDA
jgi:predicted ATPase